jgi:HK97 family phage major capsid protein
VSQHAHSWVELAQDHGGRSAGELIKLASTDEKDRLLAEGIALPCDDPEAELVRKTADRIVESAMSAVDKKLDAIARTAASAPHFAVARDRRREKLNGFQSAGEFWRAVASAGTPGRASDSRLISKAPSGLHTMEGADGGFLVPQAVSDEILAIVFSKENLLGRTDRQTIGGNSIVIKAIDETSRATGSRKGGVRAYWLSEAEKYTATKPKFREMTLKPHKLGVFYYATEEELADSASVSLEKKLAQYAAEEIGWMVDDAILNGDGVGKPLGIMNAPCLVTVSAEASQTINTFNFKNAVNMYARMLPSSVANAVWLVGVDVIPQLLGMTFPTAAGTMPAFLNGGAYPHAADAPHGTLLGRPIVVSEHMKTLGLAGDVLFADLTMYKSATRGGVSAAVSMHVRFDYAETAFRFDFRVDGQPWLTAAITPAAGGSTLSSFVALADRDE